jgi:group I intron endonuclease
MRASVISGVYKIQSIIKAERVYIGSGIDIRKRINEHLSDLRRDGHHSKKLQRHYNKYGESDLVFSIIAVCDKEELRPIDKIIRPEQFFIWAYNPYFNNYKIAGSPMGYKHTIETRTKQSMLKKGKTHSQFSDEGRRHCSEGQMGNKNCLGRVLSEETKRKISDAQKGRKMSEEKRNKMKGHLPSMETRRKMSDAHKGNKYCLGRKASDEERRFMSENRKGEKNGFWGKHHSEETKRKMSEARRGKRRAPHSESTKEKMRHPHKSYNYKG